MAKLEICPVCGVEPTMGYACGEYFTSCEDPKCPVGGHGFYEMHSSEVAQIEAWNKRVRAWAVPGRVYCGCCDYSRDSDMRCMCENSQWAGVPVKPDNYCSHGIPRSEE